MVTPARQMKFIQLFVSLSCASAAVLPVLRRYSAVKFNQLMNQNDTGYLPDNQLSLKLPAMPQFPDLTPLGRVLPISYCEAPKTNSSKKRPMDPASKMALKERLLAHNKLYPVPEPLGDFEPSKNPRFNPKGFERILKHKYFAEAALAVRDGAFDFTYIPSDPELLANFIKFIEIRPFLVRKYFEAGTIEKMRQSGLITNDYLVMILKRAIMCRPYNYYDYPLANLILDHIVVVMLKEIDSDDFDESDWQIENKFLRDEYFFGESIPFRSVITCGLIPLTAEQEQFVKFYSRYNAIFADAPLRKWKLGTSGFSHIDWI